MRDRLAALLRGRFLLRVLLLLGCSTWMPGALAEDCLVSVCSVTGAGFTVVWETPGERVTGYVRVGTAPDRLDRTVCDVREDGDPPCGFDGDDLHFVRVDGLEAGTPYHVQPYEDGSPLGPVCEVTTGPVLDPPLPEVDFGPVLAQDGQTPAASAYVVVRLEDPEGDRSAPLCGLVEPGEDGFWNVELSAARTADLGARFDPSAGATLEMAEVFGGDAGFADGEWSYGTGSPAPELVLEAYCPDGDDDGYADCTGDCPRAGGRDECGDCDDADGAINPGEPDLCNAVDDDCDPGTPDGSGDPFVGQRSCDGADADGCREGIGGCEAGSLTCDDPSGDSPEVCGNRLDDDCDGGTDEAACESAEALCDADQSGRCDGFDLGDLGRAFGSDCWDAPQRYDAALDFDADCVVGPSDLEILALGFGNSP